MEIVGAAGGGKDEVDCSGSGGRLTERVRRLSEPIERERVLRVFVGDSGGPVALCDGEEPLEEVEADERDSHLASLFGCEEGERSVSGWAAEGGGTDTVSYGDVLVRDNGATSLVESYEPTSRIPSSLVSPTAFRVGLPIILGMETATPPASDPSRVAPSATTSVRCIRLAEAERGRRVDEDEESGCGGEGTSGCEASRAAGAVGSCMVPSHHCRDAVAEG